MNFILGILIYTIRALESVEVLTLTDVNVIDPETNFPQEDRIILWRLRKLRFLLDARISSSCYRISLCGTPHQMSPSPPCTDLAPGTTRSASSGSSQTTRRSACPRSPTRSGRMFASSPLPVPSRAIPRTRPRSLHQSADTSSSRSDGAQTAATRLASVALCAFSVNSASNPRWRSYASNVRPRPSKTSTGAVLSRASPGSCPSRLYCPAR